MDFRTDMAVERRDIYKKAKKLLENSTISNLLVDFSEELGYFIH